eukprot:m51a1_g13748 putative endo- -beta-xylanase (399) ;mRNA; r:195014-196275
MLLKTAALVLCVAVTASATCTLSTSMREAAAKTGRFFGGCLTSGHFNDAKYLELADRHYGITTAENECKIDATEPQRGKFSFQYCDAVLKHAQDHNMAFRGHTLVWHGQVPQWMRDLQTPAEKKEAMVGHINGVLAHYKGQVYGWDVVNEAVDDSATKLRDSLWYPALPDFIDIAFRTARAADPKAKLFYNDYGADGLTRKSDYIYNMVKCMKQRGVPIDGVGLQMHLSIKWNPPSEDELRRNFQRFADLGLEIHLTESDVYCHNGRADWDKQAQVYTNITRACLAVSGCKSFELWGVVDQYSWLKPESTSLVFDSSYAPKPAACAIMDEFLKAAPQPRPHSSAAPQPKSESSAVKPQPQPQPGRTSSGELPDSTFGGAAHATPAVAAICIAAVELIR